MNELIKIIDQIPIKVLAEYLTPDQIRYVAGLDAKTSLDNYLATEKPEVVAAAKERSNKILDGMIGQAPANGEYDQPKKLKAEAYAKIRAERVIKIGELIDEYASCISRMNYAIPRSTDWNGWRNNADNYLIQIKSIIDKL